MISSTRFSPQSWPNTKNNHHKIFWSRYYIIEIFTIEKDKTNKTENLSIAYITFVIFLHYLHTKNCLATKQRKSIFCVKFHAVCKNYGLFVELHTVRKITHCLCIWNYTLSVKLNTVSHSLCAKLHTEYRSSLCVRCGKFPSVKNSTDVSE